MDCSTSLAPVVPCASVLDSATCSLHGPLGSGTSEDFVSDGDFLDTSPVILVAPHVAPAEEEEHGDLREEEAAEEGLLADDRHQEEGQQGGRQAVLEAAHLVLGDPVLAVLEVDLGLRGDVCVVNQEVHELEMISDKIDTIS